MFTREDIGERLPDAVYYDLDNTALKHGAPLPTPETTASLSLLAEKGIETVAVTGRDIDDCHDALIELPGRFAIISGGAITTYIKHDGAESEVMPVAALGLGFGYRVLDGVDAQRVAGMLSEWLDGQDDEADARVRIPELDRQLQWLSTGVRPGKHPFTLPGAVFMSGLSDSSVAEDIALRINSGNLQIPYRSLFAVAVTSQTGEAEVQVTAQEANKRRAIEELARLGLPVFSDSLVTDSLPDSVFIGDGLGDLPAFEAVGLSVAMADAPGEVLSAADHVIDSQQDGGFNRFIIQLANACKTNT